MLAIQSWAPSDRSVAAGCIAVALGAGWAIVAVPVQFLVTLAVLALLGAIVVAPLRWTASLIIIGLLTGPKFGFDGLLVADIAMLAAIAVLILRGPRAAPSARYLPWLLFLAWSFAVTGLDPALAPMIHTFAPLLGGYLVARMVPPQVAWTTVRWWAVVAILTAPLLTADITRRWSGIAGGPNELGLLAAALVVLSVAGTAGRWRNAQVLIGFFGLAVTSSVSAGIGAIAGVLLLRPGVRSRLAHAIPARSVLKITLVTGVLVILAARPDLVTTLAVHQDQAAATLGVLNETDPIIGGGWLHGASVIATGSLDTTYSSVLYDTVHNLYLQLVTDTGLVGLALFLAAIASVWRAADHTGQALLVLCAIWLNTTAAYPSIAWGLLGLLIAMPSSQMRCESRV